jgi:hypothetical protein
MYILACITFGKLSILYLRWQTTNPLPFLLCLFRAKPFLSVCKLHVLWTHCHMLELHVVHPMCTIVLKSNLIITKKWLIYKKNKTIVGKILCIERSLKPSLLCVYTFGSIITITSFPHDPKFASNCCQ